MESAGHRTLATATVALLIAMGIHAVRSSLAMVVWNIAEEQSQMTLVLIALGLWLAGLLGWLVVPRLDRSRATTVGVIFAAAYAAGQFIQHPILTPALAAGVLVLWLWTVPALLNLLAQADVLDVLPAGILIGLAIQVALQNALHGMDVPMLRGLLPGLGGVLMAVGLIAAWRATESVAPPGAGMLFIRGWGLFALGPYLVLQLTLLANLGRVEMITGLDLGRAAGLVLLGLAGGTAALSLAASPPLRAVAGPAAVFLAGANPFLPGAAWLPVLQVLGAIALAGAMAPGGVRSPRRSYLWGIVGMLLAFGLMVLFYARYEWVELWPLIAALVALPSLARIVPGIPTRTLRAAAAVALIGGIGLAIGQLTQHQEGRPAEAPAELRVMTYNIHMGFDAQSLPDPWEMARVIEAQAPDIVALQEVGRGWTVNGGADLVAWLRWRFPRYRVVYGPMNGDLWGNVILSRLAVTRSGWMRFPQRESAFRRGLTWAEVPTAQGDLLIIDAHFSHGPLGADRLAQADDLLAFWDGRPRTVILGDTNAGPDALPMLRLRSAGFDDTLGAGALATALTYPSLRPTERRDYILTSADIQPVSATIPQSAASDHLPVVAVLRLP